MSYQISRAGAEQLHALTAAVLDADAEAGDAEELDALEAFLRLHTAVGAPSTPGTLDRLSVADLARLRELIAYRRDMLNTDEIEAQTLDRVQALLSDHLGERENLAAEPPALDSRLVLTARVRGPESADGDQQWIVVEVNVDDVAVSVGGWYAERSPRERLAAALRQTAALLSGT